MIRHYLVKMIRVIKLKPANPMSIPPRRIRSTIEIEIKATHAAKAADNAKMFLPGWAITDCRLK